MSATILNKYIALEEQLNLLIPTYKFSKNINMRLERITHLLELLENPQNAFKTIHVGGTSGKGSTSTIISSILTTAGNKTGLHLSPHLQFLNERYQINNKIVSTNDLINVFEEIRSAITEVTNNNPFGQPSYFEVQTAMAFYLFREKQVDVAIIEVGLGGELDATNVIRPCVAVITNVGLDHTEILGDTIEKIAVDKSGIIKEGQIVVSGVSQESTKQIVKNKCINEKSILWQLGSEVQLFVEKNKSFQVVCPPKIYSNLVLSMLGDFQYTNAACAVAAALAFSGDISSANMIEGLKKAFIPGRLEVVQQHPLVILDGAHNPDKMLASVKAIHDGFPSKRMIIVLSIKSDKNYVDILKILLQKNNMDVSLILTAFEVKGLWTPTPPEILCAKVMEIAPRVNVKIVVKPLDAIKYALASANNDDLIFVTGSLYMIGDVRELWYPIEKLLKDAEELDC